MQTYRRTSAPEAASGHQAPPDPWAAAAAQRATHCRRWLCPATASMEFPSGEPAPEPEEAMAEVKEVSNSPSTALPLLVPSPQEMVGHWSPSPDLLTPELAAVMARLDSMEEHEVD